MPLRGRCMARPRAGLLRSIQRSEGSRVNGSGLISPTVLLRNGLISRIEGCPHDRAADSRSEWERWLKNDGSSCLQRKSFKRIACSSTTCVVDQPLLCWSRHHGHPHAALLRKNHQTGRCRSFTRWWARHRYGFLYRLLRLVSAGTLVPRQAACAYVGSRLFLCCRRSFLHFRPQRQCLASPHRRLTGADLLSGGPHA